MKNLLAFLICFYSLIVLPVAAKDPNVINIQASITKDKNVNLEIILIRYKTDSINPDLWGSDQEFIANTVVKNFVVRFNNEKLYIPFSAYSDLSDLNSASVVKLDSGFSVVLEGGTASYLHYKAELDFDGEGYLINRKVYSTTFSDEVWEETKYSYNRNEN